MLGTWRIFNLSLFGLVRANPPQWSPHTQRCVRVVREQFESFLASAREQAAPVARFVERELRAYLDCGVLSHGFLRAH